MQKSQRESEISPIPLTPCFSPSQRSILFSVVSENPAFFFRERERERENFVAILERENERVSERQRWGFFLNVGIGGLIWVFLKIWEVGFGGCFLKVIFFFFREKNKNLLFWWVCGVCGVSVNFGLILHAIWWRRRRARPGGTGGAGGIHIIGCVAVLVVFGRVDPALGV